MKVGGGDGDHDDDDGDDGHGDDRRSCTDVVRSRLVLGSTRNVHKA